MITSYRLTKYICTCDECKDSAIIDDSNKANVHSKQEAIKHLGFHWLANNRILCDKCFTIYMKAKNSTKVIEEPKNEIPSWCITSYDDFARECCDRCRAVPDGYCPTECDVLEKGRLIPFEKVQARYIKYQGDLSAVLQYIKRAKV